MLTEVDPALADGATQLLPTYDGSAAMFPEFRAFSLHSPLIHSFTSPGVLVSPPTDSALLCAIAGLDWLHREAELVGRPKRQVEAQPDSAASVSALHAESGLTWDQLARMLGVTRRSLHSWATGARMNGINLEAVGRALAEVRALQAVTVEDRRQALLSPGVTGESVFDRLRRIASNRNSVVDPALPLEVGAGL